MHEKLANLSNFCFTLVAYLVGSSSWTYCVPWDAIYRMEMHMTGEYRQWFGRIKDRNTKARINARFRLCV